MESSEKEAAAKTEESHNIKPGATLQLPVEVYDKDSALVLEFSETGGVEFPFSIAFNESETSPAVEQSAVEGSSQRKQKSPTFMVYGPTPHSFGLFVVCFESTGVAEFIWDNSASFFRSKTIKYSVTAYRSEAEATTAVATMRTKYRDVKHNFQRLSQERAEQQAEQKKLSSLTSAHERRQQTNKTRAEKIAALESRVASLSLEQSTLSEQIQAAEGVLAKMVLDDNETKEEQEEASSPDESGSTPEEPPAPPASTPSTSPPQPSPTTAAPAPAVSPAVVVDAGGSPGKKGKKKKKSKKGGER